jgi:hypothetical protein
MAKILIVQLANSEGLAKIVLFTGLSHPVLLHPIVHGEPVLTAQAFYYLEELETVAKIRFESERDELNEQQVEYLIDNYLFEFSKIYPHMTMNPKVERGKFWRDELSEFYIDVDQRHTRSLAIDSANDPDVLSVISEDRTDAIDLFGWDIGRNYARDCLLSYFNALTSVLEKKVVVNVSPSAHRDGYRGKLLVLKPDDGLIDYWQASALTDIGIQQIGPAVTEFTLPKSFCERTTNHLPVERIVVTKQHTPILLSYYFSGLKETNPLKAFIGFYNVLEYFFEAAPLLLGRAASNERTQLECVISLTTSDDEISKFLHSLAPLVQQKIFAGIPTSSGRTIDALNIEHNIEANLAKWLYEIRCAIIHSKRTRRGRATSTFEPYSSASSGLHAVIPIMQWLAVLSIEKNYSITAAQGQIP